MNARSFKVIFSKRLGALVAVGENATSQGKGATGEGARGVAVEASSALSYVGALKTLCLAALVGTMPKGFALDANALPSGGEVRHGAATVGSVGATMTINQTSSRATINWQSFNVGSGAKVNIVQPSSSAALLNRVVGNEMSHIHGQINANGQVVLVNPNGVLVGSSGAITASAFTATTFGISDADFNAGNMRLSRNGSSASVVNQGTINTQGDYVALIGASVSNSGTISTSGGNAMLGAGDAVSIPLAGNIRLELAPAAFASVDNSGTITTAGGQVFMRASAVVDAVSKVANATVTHSGTINTSGGRVDILADHGTVRVSGTIVGSKPTSTTSAETETETETAADTGTATETATPAEETSNADTPASPTTTDTDSTPSTAETPEPEAVAEPEAAAEPQAVAEPATPPAPATTTQTTTPPAVADTTPAPSTPVVVAAEPQPEPTSSPVSAPVSTSTDTPPAPSTPVVLEVPKVPTAPDVGGSIFIGRDETTNVLAAVGDASGARLESVGGFVETSGQFLKVDGARVIAKDWLLDPVNITIAGSGATGTPYGDSDGATAGVQYNPSTGSTILASDIAANLNAGTSVKISTGLAGSSGNQDGNIDVNASIEKTGTAQATLTLEANNRINIANGVKITDGSTNNLSVHLIANGAGGGSQSFVMGRDSAIDVGGDVTVDVTSLNKNGVNENSAIFMNAGSRLRTDTTSPYTTGRTYIRGKDVNINMTLSGANRMGMFTQHAVGIEATGSQLNITSNYTDELLPTTNRRIGLFMGSGWGAGNPTHPAFAFLRADNGAITVDNKSSGVDKNAGGINLAGTQVTAKGDINLRTSNVRATDTAINIGQEFHAPVVQSAEGNVTIIADQGSVQMGSLAPNAIKGKHVVIANTGGRFDPDSGTFSAGTGTFKGNNGGSVGLSGWGNSVVASGNMTVVGVGDTSGSAGIVLNGAGLLAGGNLNVTGKHVGPGTTNGIFSTGTFESQNSNVNITGVSELGSALSLHSNVKAKNAVNISGTNTGTTNTTQAIYIKRNVTATEGNILITANSAGSTTQALRLDGGSSLNTTSETAQIVIKSDSVSLDGSASTSIKAGATGKGTVEIRNLSEGVKVNLGGADVNTSASDRTLGLDNAELQRIIAGQLIIGSETGGNIQISSNVTTNSTTGDVTLKTKGDIDFAASLKTGGATGDKKLSLKSDGTISGSATGVITTKELEIDSANLITNPHVALSAATHQISQIFGKTREFDLKNGRSLIVGSSSDTRGLIANGAVRIESTSTDNGAGIHVKENISTSAGNVTLTGTSPTGNGVHIRKDVQTQDGSVTIKGTSNGSASAVLAQLPTDGSQIFASQGILIEGISATGTGVDLDSGFLGSSGVHDFGTGNAIHIKGSTGTDSATVAGVRLNDITVANWNSTGKIVIEATKGALVSTAAAKITQNANANVELSTDNLGDLSAAKINKQSNGSGDIILSAGKSLATGNGSGGQVKPVDGNTITNNGTGKLLVYTGNANDTGVLKHLTSAFDTLYLAGTRTNVAFDKAFGATLTNGPAAQVLFRQNTALPTVSGNLDQATFTRDYNGQTVAQNGDLTKLKDALKAVNTGNFTSTVNNNTFGVAKADVIDLLALDTASNGIKNVKRNSSTKVAEAHTLTLDTSAVTDPTTGLSGFSFSNPNAQSVALMIRPLSARVSANATTVTTTGAVQTQTATVEGFLPAEAGGVNVSGLRSESAPGTYNSNVVVTANDPDLLGNYDIAVTNAALTIASAPTPAPTPGPTPGPAPSPNELTPFIPPVNPATAPINLTGRGSATLVGAGDSFRLASAEEGQCTQDTLEFCECEEAKDEKGLSLSGVQLCFEPKETAKIAI